jgi:hypothetical protein
MSVDEPKPYRNMSNPPYQFTTPAADSSYHYRGYHVKWGQCDIASGYWARLQRRQVLHTLGPFKTEAEANARIDDWYCHLGTVQRGQKGQKPERYDLIPWDQMDEVARVYGRGAEKYDDRNWELGVDLSLNFAALHRHLSAFWNGQSVDPETECHHLAAVVFHALAMMRNQTAHPDCDDRPEAARP